MLTLNAKFALLLLTANKTSKVSLIHRKRFPNKLDTLKSLRTKLLSFSEYFPKII